LYQSKNFPQKVRASARLAKLPGNSGQYFTVLNSASL